MSNKITDIDLRGAVPDFAVIRHSPRREAIQIQFICPCCEGPLEITAEYDYVDRSLTFTKVESR